MAIAEVVSGGAEQEQNDRTAHHDLPRARAPGRDRSATILRLSI
jgi:hypothetical protein